MRWPGVAKTRKGRRRSGGAYTPSDKALAKGKARARSSGDAPPRPSVLERIAAWPRRTVWLSALGVAGVLLGVALLVQLVASPSGSVTATVLDARDAFLETKRLRAGDDVHPAPIRVRAGGHLALQIDEARLDVDDAAELMVRPGGLWLRDGAARVTGPLFVTGARCEVDLRGTTRLEIIDRGMRITPEAAGEAHPRGDPSRCHIDRTPE